MQADGAVVFRRDFEDREEALLIDRGAVDVAVDLQPIGTEVAAAISSSVRLRMNTGLPRHLTIMQLPGCRLPMSTSSEASARTSAAGFMAAKNLTTSRRAAEAPMKRAPPIIV